MSIKLANIKRSRGRSRGVTRYKAMAEINMTPFIDVMLVLLIVFMISAPLISTGVKVNLPTGKSGKLKPKSNPITISIDQQGDIFILNDKLDESNFIKHLLSITKGDVQKNIYIRGDKDIQYGRVVKLLSMLTVAGYRKVAIISKDQDR